MLQTEGMYDQKARHLLFPKHCLANILSVLAVNIVTGRRTRVWIRTERLFGYCMNLSTTRRCGKIVHDTFLFLSLRCIFSSIDVNYVTFSMQATEVSDACKDVSLESIFLSLCTLPLRLTLPGNCFAAFSLENYVINGNDRLPRVLPSLKMNLVICQII